VPKIGQVSNRKSVTKDTIWQRIDDVGAPIAGALLFACLLAAVTVWFSQGAAGSWLALLGLGFALITLAFGQGRVRSLVIPVLLAIAAVGLGLFGGGFSSAAACAVLWPLLATAAYGGRLEQGVGASLCALAGLAGLNSVIAVPVTDGFAAQSGILALGVCGALAIAASVRFKWGQHGLSRKARSALDAALISRDAALADAKSARAETQGRAQFMAEMSHEIRTPLNAILGFADTMREGVFGPLPQAYGDYPDLIHTSGSHLLDLVSDLLDLSKIEAGRYETQLKAIRLDEIAHEGVRLSSGAARGAGVQIRHEASGPVEIMGDARALRQIVFNLLSNAIKFTPNGGRVTVRVVVSPDAKTARLEVEDTGVGMSDADLAKVGEPWNQAKYDAARDSKNGRGSGLGLALVKRLTDLQGGQFDIQSALGDGTRARVQLPLAV
jgi:signal transduction histidine kinase